MKNDIKDNELKQYIIKYLDLLDNNFSVRQKNKIPYKELHEMIVDLNKMINEYSIYDYKETSNMCIKRFIPLLNLMIKIEKSKDIVSEYIDILKNAYRIASRESLFHYMIYREWDERDKFFQPRISIMQGYIHYLQEIAKNPKFEILIANLPSGYGKTYPEKISEAWNFGVNPSGTVLSLCSNEDVVKGGSRTVIDEIKSSSFGEVFPNMKYDENDKKFFLKETDGNWKLKDCKLSSSYYAKTVQSNVVGSRASQRIHIDDLYADYKEAQNSSLNEYYFNKYLTVWRKRFVQNLTPKIVITGTLWASGDFIALVIDWAKKNYKFHKHPVYPYTYVNDDETIAIIQVPALDYETNLSTCPSLRTTEEIMQDKNSMSEYLFQTNFQQRPTDPEALMFSYGKIRDYDTIPKTDYYGTYSVIDATRKSGKDYFSMPIFSKVSNENNFDYYLKDCIFTKKATKDMYEEVCNKIIENHIIELVIESNVTTELKKNIDSILELNGISFCSIREKYNVENKNQRIIDESGVIQRRLVFPSKNKYGANSDIGRFMDNLTNYSSDGRNSHDDAPDSCGMFTHEIIEGGSLPNKVKAVYRPF